MGVRYREQWLPDHAMTIQDAARWERAPCPNKGCKAGKGLFRAGLAGI